MEIKERRSDDVLILDLSGKLTIGTGDVTLRDKVASALEAGETKILLNMGGVSAMDSSGVGELVAAYTSANNRQGLLKLANLSQRVGGVLQATRLTGVLDMFDAEKDALASFAG
jgi:anti-sigma B factor antagonist